MIALAGLSIFLVVFFVAFYVVLTQRYSERMQVEQLKSALGLKTKEFNKERADNDKIMNDILARKERENNAAIYELVKKHEAEKEKLKMMAKSYKELYSSLATIMENNKFVAEDQWDPEKEPPP